MAAPAYVQTGAGATDATGVWSAGGATYMPVNIGAGNILVLQVLQDGTGTSPTLTSIETNISNLAGTTAAMTSIGEFNIGNPVVASQHLWIGRHVGGTRTVTISGDNAGGDDLYFRVYEFTGVSTGTTLGTVIENGSAGATVSGAGTSATIADADVTTLGAERLALNFVAGNDDNTLDAFTGMTGGTWAEAVAEYADSAGTDGVIGLQTATIAAAGTIGGGTDGWADAADGWGVVGFALLPAGPAAASLLLPNRSKSPIVRRF